MIHFEIVTPEKVAYQDKIDALTIDTKDGVKVNDARVVKTDIEASNGVIHVIDTVLMPK